LRPKGNTLTQLGVKIQEGNILPEERKRRQVKKKKEVPQHWGAGRNDLDYFEKRKKFRGRKKSVKCSGKKKMLHRQEKRRENCVNRMGKKTLATPTTTLKRGEKKGGKSTWKFFSREGGKEKERGGVPLKQTGGSGGTK